MINLLWLYYEWCQSLYKYMVFKDRDDFDEIIFFSMTLKGRFTPPQYFACFKIEVSTKPS
jgi:hypothetical protein